MTKGLAALENIKREAGTPYFSTLYDIDDWKEDFKIIEKELKALEIIKKCRIKVEKREDFDVVGYATFRKMASIDTI